MFALEGGNIGFQLGGQATDFVLLVMNPKGADSIMGSKVKLGADAAASAGPKGRNAAAATDCGAPPGWERPLPSETIDSRPSSSTISGRSSRKGRIVSAARNRTRPGSVAITDEEGRFTLTA